MKYIVVILFLASCMTKQSNEMEEMGEEVLKHKQGLEIDIKPLSKESVSNESPPELPQPNPPGIPIIKIPFNRPYWT